MTDRTLKCEIDAQQIKFKDILDKQFLEVEIYAISDINPNRNRSHFTLDAMKKALPTFTNKPIVGFFNNGDFEGHNGKLKVDVETDNVYWDTDKGERVLGVIRESDPVQIVDVDGINWIKLRCVLFVSYCYKQIKRILKDKTKRVSVEITIKDAYVREDGIEEIEDFVLNGITILGSRNGKAVQEAIPGAHLCILDNLDQDEMVRQTKMLSFAYQQLDGDPIEVESTRKEDEQTVIEETINSNHTEECESEVVTTTETVITETVVAPIETVEEEIISTYETEETVTVAEVVESESVETESTSTPIETEEEIVVLSEVADHVAEEVNNCVYATETEVATESTEDEGGCDCDEECGTECECDGGCEEPLCDEDKEVLRQELQEAQCKCSEYEVKIADLEAKLAQYSDYEEIKERMTVAEGKVFQTYCDNLVATARQQMEYETLADADRENILAKASRGEYATTDDLNRDIAYAVYTARQSTTKSEHYNVALHNEYAPESKKTLTREERLAAKVIRKH